MPAIQFLRYRFAGQQSKRVAYVLQQLALIFLDRQNVVGLLAGDRLLAADNVKGDHTTLQFQHGSGLLEFELESVVLRTTSRTLAPARRAVSGPEILVMEIC